MTVTDTEQWVTSRNGRRKVTQWNKCVGPGCENSVHEHEPSEWSFKRSDARYCSNACRQRAYRTRSKT
jgi:hypothetical protein